MAHPRVAQVVENGTMLENGCRLVGYTVHSVITAAYLHARVDSMHWEPGMLALPTHDAPWWWWTDDE